MQMNPDARIKALAGGVLLGMSFPPFPFPVLAPLGFAFIWLADASLRNQKNGWLWPYAGLLVWNLIATYWLTMATIGGGLASIFANAGVMFLALRLSGWFLRQRLPVMLRAAGAAGCWLLFETFHHWWDLAWPWLSLGNAWSSWPAAIQFYSILGATGGSFLTALLAAVIAIDLQDKASLRWKPIVLVMLPFIVSIPWYVFQQEYDSNRTVRVAVLQPNHDSYLPNSGYTSQTGPTEALAAQTQQLLDSTAADIVLWPENGVDGLIYLDYPSNILGVIQQLSRETGKTVITGSSLYSTYKEMPSFLTRISPSGVAYDIFNSAIAVDSAGIKQIYRKKHLVPIVERFPFADYLLEPLSSIFDVRSMIGYGKGREITLFEADSALFPAFVCYDSVFPFTVNEAVAFGAGFIGIITNDGWWGNSSGHIQHFEYARLRAIEQRRFVIRGANNGISGLVHPSGRVLKSTEYWTKDAFVSEVPVLSGRTFFSRFPYLMIWASVGFVLINLIFSKRVVSSRE